MGKKTENDIVFLNGNAQNNVVLEMTEPDNNKQIAVQKDINKNVSDFLLISGLARVFFVIFIRDFYLQDVVWL